MHIGAKASRIGQIIGTKDARLSVIMKSQPKSSNAKTLSEYLSFRSDKEMRKSTALNAYVRLGQGLQQLRHMVGNVVHLQRPS